MFVCELNFDLPDRGRPGLSFHETDYYQWSGDAGGVEGHGLSLRKNLETGFFEVYRRFVEKRAFAVGGGGVLVAGSTLEDTGREEVVFRGSFSEALRWARRETQRVHGFDPGDEPCHHRPGNRSFICKELRR